MMAPPRIGMAEDAQLAPTFSWANSDAARGERARDQRVFHAERNPHPRLAGHLQRPVNHDHSAPAGPGDRRDLGQALSKIARVYTDTHGFSAYGGSLGWILGVLMCPRRKNFNDRRLHV